MLTITDDRGRRVALKGGRRVALKGEWTGRLVGTNFGHGGQILAWVAPADPDAYVELIEEAPGLSTAPPMKAIPATSSAPRRLTEGN